MNKEILDLVEQIKEWNDGDKDSLIEHGDAALDLPCVKTRAKVIGKLQKLLSKTN